jgi:hypothetical protein
MNCHSSIDSAPSIDSDATLNSARYNSDDSRNERPPLSPQDFPFDEQPEHSLPPVRKRNRHAYFQTAESMRVLSEMEYSSWTTTTTPFPALVTGTSAPAPVASIDTTTTTTNVSTVTPPAVSVPSSRRQAAANNTKPVMPARSRGAPPQQPHPWTWDTSTYTSFPPPSHQDQAPPYHHLEPPPEPLFPLSMPHFPPYDHLEPPPEPLFPLRMPQFSSTLPHQTPPPLAPHQQPHQPPQIIHYSHMLPPLPPPVSTYYVRGPPPPPPPPPPTTMSLYPTQSVLARNYRNPNKNEREDYCPHEQTGRSMMSVGHPSLRIVRGRLPVDLDLSLSDLIDLAEQRAACLPTQWKTDLYSLTKQDLPVCEIPGSLPLVGPIQAIICEQIRRLYGRSVRMDKNQPHLLKYSFADQQTGVQLHHDRCDVTANLTLSQDSDYTGGGTYYPATGCTLRLSRGEFVLHPGSLVHAGTDITSGTRHLLVFFCHFE